MPDPLAKTKVDIKKRHAHHFADSKLGSVLVDQMVEDVINTHRHYQQDKASGQSRWMVWAAAMVAVGAGFLLGVLVP